MSHLYGFFRLRSSDKAASFLRLTDSIEKRRLGRKSWCLLQPNFGSDITLGLPQSGSHTEAM